MAIPLIVGFDGINKAGKSTLINKVKEELSNNFKVKVLHGLKSGMNEDEYSYFLDNYTDLTNGHYDNWINEHVLKAWIAHGDTLKEAVHFSKGFDIVLMDRTLLTWIKYSRRVNKYDLPFHMFKKLSIEYNNFIDCHTEITQLCQEFVDMYDLLINVKSHKARYSEPYKKELKTTRLEKELTYSQIQLFLAHTEKDLEEKSKLVVSKILELKRSLKND